MSSDGARLIVRLGQGRFALPTALVAEVAPLNSLTPVPGQDKVLLGVVNLRGDIRPVLDLHGLMALPPPGTDVRPWAVFVRLGRNEVGLRVDGVEGLADPVEGAAIPELPLARIATVDCLGSRIPGKDGTP